jgi:hypothetical protein
MNRPAKTIAICILVVLGYGLIYVWRSQASDALAISVGLVSALAGFAVAVIEKVRLGGSWTAVFGAVVALAGLFVAVDLPLSRLFGY